MVNLCRNTESHHRDGGRPKYGLDIAYIDENSDFSYIYHGISDTPIEKLYYMRNFIRYTPFYRNSHLSKMAMKRYYGTFGFSIKYFVNWSCLIKARW